MEEGCEGQEGAARGDIKLRRTENDLSLLDVEKMFYKICKTV